MYKDPTFTTWTSFFQSMGGKKLLWITSMKLNNLVSSSKVSNESQCPFLNLYFSGKAPETGVNDKPQDMANYTFQLNSTCQEIHTRTCFFLLWIFFFLPFNFFLNPFRQWNNQKQQYYNINRLLSECRGFSPGCLYKCQY